MQNQSFTGHYNGDGEYVVRSNKGDGWVRAYRSKEEADRCHREDYRWHRTSLKSKGSRDQAPPPWIFLGLVVIVVVIGAVLFL